MRTGVVIAISVAGVVGLLLAVLVVEAFLAVRGMREDFKNPSREPRALGTPSPTSSPLTYAVLGDSTAAGQGASAGSGIAPSTASKLAESRPVNFINVAVSGATTPDIINDQLSAVVARKPDLVLISAGANDVTHLTRSSTVVSNLGVIVDQLIAANCNVKIVITGSPDMGGARRFAQPLRWIAGERSRQLNQRVKRFAEERQVTFAPIADQTGPPFRRDPTLLAADRFHPNDRGYALWIDVLNPSLADALATQPSHCP